MSGSNRAGAQTHPAAFKASDKLWEKRCLVSCRVEQDEREHGSPGRDPTRLGIERHPSIHGLVDPEFGAVENGS
jgi:hypothetical protein